MQNPEQETPELAGCGLYHLREPVPNLAAEPRRRVASFCSTLISEGLMRMSLAQTGYRVRRENPLSFPRGGNPIKGSWRRPPGIPAGVCVVRGLRGVIWFPFISIIIKSICLSYLPPNWCWRKIFALTLGRCQGEFKTPYCVGSSQCRVSRTPEPRWRQLGSQGSWGAGGRSAEPRPEPTVSVLSLVGTCSRRAVGVARRRARRAQGVGEGPLCRRPAWGPSRLRAVEQVSVWNPHGGVSLHLPRSSLPL